MAQITFAGNGRTFTGRRDLTDHDHDALLLVFQSALEASPTGTNVLNVALLATHRVQQVARAQGWTDAAAENLACTAGLIYADIIKDAHREELIDAQRR